MDLRRCRALLFWFSEAERSKSKSNPLRGNLLRRSPRPEGTAYLRPPAQVTPDQPAPLTVSARARGKLTRQRQPAREVVTVRPAEIRPPPQLPPHRPHHQLMIERGRPGLLIGKRQAQIAEERTARPVHGLAADRSRRPGSGMPRHLRVMSSHSCRQQQQRKQQGSSARSEVSHEGHATGRTAPDDPCP